MASRMLPPIGQVALLGVDDIFEGGVRQRLVDDASSRLLDDLAD